MSAVLVLGGYGVFGSRLCELLAASDGPTVFVAGRRLAAASAVASRLHASRAEAVALDRDAPDGISAFLKEQRPQVVVDAVGPYQKRDYRLAELVAAHGAHSLDLADDRSYVTGISALDALARSRGVLLASGASTVPALSGAVVERLLHDLDSLEAVEIGISPGQRAPRGLATIRSVLSYCGKPIPAVAPAHRAARRGWGDLGRHRYPPPVGGRWLSNVDLPDSAVLAARYPGVESIVLRAGLELSVVHLGLSFLSLLVARGWISSLAPASRFLGAVAAALAPFGSEAGAMHVTIVGARAGLRFRRHWTIVAEHNDGPYIPVAAASVLAKRLCGAAGYAPLTARGATPCVGLLELDEILMELRGRAIRTQMFDEQLGA
jgi:hypothetical protein